MATQKAFATYQEIYDVNTVSDNVSIIGIHTPVGAKPRKMLAGFFTQFRKYKYLGCSVVGSVASRLPLDKMNIAITEGQTGVDPRDVFNPILSHGCHGDNLTTALNNIYKGSFAHDGSSMSKDDFDKDVVPVDTSWETMYYRMLQDPSFKKHSMDRGFALKGLRPMVYNVASNHQIMPSEDTENIGKLKYAGSVADVQGFDDQTFGSIPTGSGTKVNITPQFITNRLQSLGWLDTRQVLNGVDQASKVNPGVPAFTVLPRILMSVLILPPAYRVSTAFRIIVTHRFAFREFNTSMTLEGATEYYNWLSQLVPSGKKDNDTLSVKDGDVTARSDGVY